MDFRPMLSSVAARPQSQTMKALQGGFQAGLRDQLTLSTWLLIGAALQSVIFLILPHALYMTLPVILVLLFRAASTALQVYGCAPNPNIENVVPGRVSAQIPDMNGQFSGKPSGEDIVVMFLNTKSNHPLGIFGPGFRQLGDYFTTMAAELNTIEGREQYGFLGMSTWLSTSHAASNELMNVLYFLNVEGVHAFANGKTHREAWNWFNKMTKTHPHLSISHEIYGVQKGNWENIFVNFEPTNIGDTWFMKKERDAEVEWVNPLVDASNRDLATSAARLGSKRHD